MVVGDIWVCYMCVSPPHLSLWSLCLVCVLCGGTAVVPPDQRGTEPLHLTQVDQKGTVWTVHTVEGIAGVGGPTCTHPLGEKHGNINLKTLQKLDVQYHFVRTCYYTHTHTHVYTYIYFSGTFWKAWFSWDFALTWRAVSDCCKTGCEMLKKKRKKIFSLTQLDYHSVKTSYKCMFAML